MSTSLIALLVGAVAGCHSATWGMYKDSPHEGFTYLKYSRSIVFSAVVAVIAELLMRVDVTKASGLLILYGVTYAVERTLLEVYKTFLREEDQSKYFIPMQFHVAGRVVEGRLTRWSVGAAYLVVLLLVVFGLRFLQTAEFKIPPLFAVFLVGSAGGWISAFGGAWKDAPLEGFSLLKFLRSPLLACAFGLLMALFTESYLYVFLSAIGYTVGTIETYKTFLFPSKPRGKFAGKEIRYPEMLQRRKRFVPLYCGIWLMMIVTFVVALQQPREGLL